MTTLMAVVRVVYSCTHGDCTEMNDFGMMEIAIPYGPLFVNCQCQIKKMMTRKETPPAPLPISLLGKVMTNTKDLETDGELSPTKRNDSCWIDYRKETIFHM